MKPLASKHSLFLCSEQIYTTHSPQKETAEFGSSVIEHLQLVLQPLDSVFKWFPGLIHSGNHRALSTQVLNKLAQCKRFRMRIFVIAPKRESRRRELTLSV